MNRLAIESPIEFVAAAESEGMPSGPKKFAIEAYTGAAIRQGWSAEPIVIDLQGMKFNQRIPIVLGHDYGLGSILGQSTSIRAENGRLYVEGEILADSESSRNVVALAAAGFSWQASVGADVMRHQKVPQGESVTVNGQTFMGPVRVVKASKLREVSFVTLGADDATSARIAAMAKELSMAHDANQTPEEVVASTEATATAAVEKVEASVAVTPDHDAKIKALTEDIENMKKVIAARERAPAIHVVEEVNQGKAIEAALCLQGGLPSVVAEQSYDARTLEAADKLKRSTSIGEVLLEAARANGYTGSSRISAGNAEPVLKAAFATHDISQLLSAVVNKFLLNGFNAVESVWQEISAIRSVNDFKAINMFRLNGDMKFQKVGNAGELKVAKATDYKRSLAAETWGISTSLTRQDMINDDLNALSQIPQRMGRGAALALNETIWAEFLSSNSTYYQAATPGAGNALAYASLESAVTAFRRLTDPDGNPLGIAPRILLVPPELEPKAAQLMTQSALVVSSLGSTSSKAVEPSANVFAGRYRILTSNYLTSTSTWWLMADAADLAAMDVVFLNGQQAPTIEQVAPDYQLLGVAMRGYFDFGVTKAEPLSTYRMATA